MPGFPFKELAGPKYGFLPFDFQTVLPYGAFSDTSLLSKITYPGLRTLQSKKFKIEIAGNWAFDGSSGSSNGSGSGTFDYVYTVAMGRVGQFGSDSYLSNSPPYYPTGANAGYFVDDSALQNDVIPADYVTSCTPGIIVAPDESTVSTSYYDGVTYSSPLAVIAVPGLVNSGGGGSVALSIYRQIMTPVYVLFTPGIMLFGVNCSNLFNQGVGYGGLILTTGTSAPALPSYEETTVSDAGHGVYTSLGFNLWWQAFTAVPATPVAGSTFSITTAAVSDV
jgi:hypothetical protein